MILVSFPIYKWLSKKHSVVLPVNCVDNVILVDDVVPTRDVDVAGVGFMQYAGVALKS